MKKQSGITTWNTIDVQCEESKDTESPNATNMPWIIIELFGI